MWGPRSRAAAGEGMWDTIDCHFESCDWIGDLNFVRVCTGRGCLKDR